MKKYFLIVFIIFGLLIVSGCISNGNDNQEPKSATNEGVVIKYPSDWQLAKSAVNDTIISVGNPNFKEPGTNYGTVSVNIQKKKSSSSLKSAFDSNYKTMFSNSSYTQISEGNTTIGQYTALECVYTVESKSNTSSKQYKAIWIEQDGYLYVILCTAPVSQFDNQKKYFDYILDNFRIT